LNLATNFIAQNTDIVTNILTKKHNFGIGYSNALKQLALLDRADRRPIQTDHIPAMKISCNVGNTPLLNDMLLLQCAKWLCSCFTHCKYSR